MFGKNLIGRNAPGFQKSAAGLGSAVAAAIDSQDFESLDEGTLRACRVTETRDPGWTPR